MLAVTNTDRIYELLRRYAWNVTAYQIVNPGIVHWFSRDGDAVIGYMQQHGLRIVAGAPVCAAERLSAILEEWNADTARCRERSCYFGAAGRLHETLTATRGYSTIVLGAQPVWDLREWPEPSRLRSSLRAQLSRARNKGVRVVEWNWQRAEHNPELQRVLTEWLQRKPLPSLHFLIEPQTLHALQDKRIFVAERDGIPIGFLNAAPVPARNGYLTEQFVRGRSAPNGTVESMVDFAFRALADGGAEYVTMGLAPLAEAVWDPAHVNPFWLRLILAWIRAHGNRFYNFAGLEAFKTKFGPQSWEPIYAISQERHFSPWTLYAIADAFANGSLPSTLLSGAGKALRTEWKALVHVRPAPGQTPARNDTSQSRR